MRNTEHIKNTFRGSFKYILNTFHKTAKKKKNSVNLNNNVTTESFFIYRLIKLNINNNDVCI
jgi:hypothetical protein